VFAVAGAALYWRRRAPVRVLITVLAGWTVLAGVDLLLGGGHELDLGWMTIIALYSIGRYATMDWWGHAAAVGATLAMVNVSGLANPNPWWEEAVWGTIFLSGVWYVGRRLRSRQQRAAELLRERAAEARRIVAEERARIARELHDVVAHRVSLMTVQAVGARAVAAEDPEAARQAMGAVEEAGRQALEELRHLLGVLRPPAERDELGPQPSLADLPRLIAEIRRAGVDVTLVTEALPDGLPARTDLFAFRIVQEALTNVLKHAGPGARAEVRLRTDRRAIVVEVYDNGRGAAAVPAPGAASNGSGGHGIIGMRERALLLDGDLRAEPRPEGGFRVVAHLPIEGRAA
jgi:signal transduction histidine kinase